MAKKQGMYVFEESLCKVKLRLMFILGKMREKIRKDERKEKKYLVLIVHNKNGK